MPDRPRFINGGVYHVYNRGVEKRKIVGDVHDHLRFVHALYVFNDKESIPTSWYYLNKLGGRTSQFVDKLPEERNQLVDIVAWALMPNHYHLLLRQRRDKGVSLFMQKIGTAHTMYFNERYERSGVLFQGGYKLRVVDKDNYMRHLLAYIHLNPVDLFAPKWKEGGVKNAVAAIQGLGNYRWSSYQDYIGKKNFPSVIDMKAADDYALPIGDEHQKLIEEWISDAEVNIDDLYGVAANLPRCVS